MLVKIYMKCGRNKGSNFLIFPRKKGVREEINYYSGKGINKFIIYFTDSEGNETLDEEILLRQFNDIKKEFPEVKIGIGTRIQNGMTKEKRIKELSSWNEFKPDFLSLNLSEEGSMELREIILQKGIKIEYCISSLNDARIYTKTGDGKTISRVIYETAITSEAEIMRTKELILYFRKHHQDDEIILYSEVDLALDLINYCEENNIDTRIGFKDTVVLPSLKYRNIK